jgi:hypothetical protein
MSRVAMGLWLATIPREPYLTFDAMTVKLLSLKQISVTYHIL